jgi:hypothetical protein
MSKTTLLVLSEPQCSAPHSSRQVPRSRSSVLLQVRHQPSLVLLQVSLPVARLQGWAPAVLPLVVRTHLSLALRPATSWAHLRAILQVLRLISRV